MNMIYFQRKQEILENKIHDDKFTHSKMSVDQKSKKQVGSKEHWRVGLSKAKTEWEDTEGATITKLKRS